MNMAISYKKLWKKLIDEDLKKKDLAEIAKLSTYTINKLNRCENVNTDTLTKICKALNCSFDDIMEIVDDEQVEVQNG
jgi:putative transcriptional regulator